MDRRLVSQLIIVAMAAVLQSLSWFSLGGIKINLAFIVLLAFAFLIRDWRWYLLLVMGSALILRVGDNWDWLVVGVIAIPLLVYLTKKFLPWQSLISYLIFVALATAGFYGLIDWRFAFDNPLIFFQELVYNLLFGGLVYMILARFYSR